MYQPLPHGLSAVGGAPTEEDSAAVELLARRLTNLKQLSGLDSMRMVRQLPSGGYVIAQNMGGVFRAITHNPLPPAQPEPFDGIAKDYIPMLFSGVITKEAVKEGEGVGIKLTEQCRRRIAGYKGSNLPDKNVELQRFVIGYHQTASEFKPAIQGLVFHTQYLQQRPTWYSGAMAEVMQIVGGYGKQDFEQLPESRIERSRLLIPAKVKRKISLEMINVRLPGYTGIPDKEGQFQYDYKFHNTNGVAFDELGNPWLLRISTAGIHAMPLPIVPATATKAFREWIEEVGDDEILKILDRFGGMPSGENFPILSKAFEAWRRAGVIIKVCDTSDFYQHIMYSSACGWSFNSMGTEGFNTCYDYYDDEGLGYGLAYGVNLKIGAASNNGKLPPTFDLDSSEDARRLDSYLSSIYRLMSDDSPEHLAVKYKLRRVPVGDILARAKQGLAGTSELEYWGSEELEPIAIHSGNVAEVSRGYIYHPAKFQYQPQIKFPEPFMGGCVSHDFLPLINGRYKDEYPNSDTIMFGYYVGDQLKVIKYFRDSRSRSKPTEDNYEDCMIVGSWERAEYLSPSRIVGNFYTTDLDLREETSEQIRDTEIIGTDMGYDSKPYFAFDAPFWMPGSMWRNRYYKHKTTTVTSGSRSVNIGMCIPYLDRNSVIHAYTDAKSGVEKRVTERMYSVTDPHSYRFYTYDFNMHWAGGADRNGNAGSSAGETPHPKDSNPVWVVAYNYNPGGCSDFADQGDWVGSLPADYTWLVHPQSNVWQLSGGGGPPLFEPMTKVDPPKIEVSDRLDYLFSDQPQRIAGVKPHAWYFEGSPNDLGDVFYRDCSRVLIGDVEYANVSEAASAGMNSTRKYWGKSALVESTSAHHFIGVINE